MGVAILPKYFVGVNLPTLFEEISSQIYQNGLFIKKNALPTYLLQSLIEYYECDDTCFKAAGIGRGVDHNNNEVIRRDAIAWISEDVEEGREWHQWAKSLQDHLNRHLLLGLFSFESHFASYQAGDFYRKHFDAFRGKTNRKLSLLTYLNRDWGDDDGGELVIYDDRGEAELARVTPEFGTLVVFLSEDFPHEVLPSAKERLSVAGWFRVNSEQDFGKSFYL